MQILPQRQDWGSALGQGLGQGVAQGVNEHYQDQRQLQQTQKMSALQQELMSKKIDTYRAKQKAISQMKIPENEKLQEYRNAALEMGDNSLVSAIDERLKIKPDKDILDPATRLKLAEVIKHMDAEENKDQFNTPAKRYAYMVEQGLPTDFAKEETKVPLNESRADQLASELAFGWRDSIQKKSESAHRLDIHLQNAKNNIKGTGLNPWNLLAEKMGEGFEWLRDPKTEIFSTSMKNYMEGFQDIIKGKISDMEFKRLTGLLPHEFKGERANAALLAAIEAKSEIDKLEEEITQKIVSKNPNGYPKYGDRDTVNKIMEGKTEEIIRNLSDNLQMINQGFDIPPKGHIYIYNPNGKIGTVHATDIEQALSEGYMRVTNE